MSGSEFSNYEVNIMQKGIDFILFKLFRYLNYYFSMKNSNNQFFIDLYEKIEFYSYDIMMTYSDKYGWEK